VPTSTRFAVAIHLLVGLALHQGRVVRSEDLACSVNTNPAVVRRILGLLADAGLTQAQMGQGGGTVLARPAGQITLLDIYRAVEEPHYFALHRSGPNPACYIGHAIIPVLETEFQRVTGAMDAALMATTVADVARQVEARAGTPFVPPGPGAATPH
jgi:Rrf2 family protein